LLKRNRPGIRVRSIAAVVSILVALAAQHRTQAQEISRVFVCPKLRAGKQVADSRVERSLYQRAVGYRYEAVKIFMPAGRAKPVYAKHIEHVPADVTAGIFWLKNRDPQHWRDSQQMEHVLG
jgi:hypothetical protein